MRAPEDTQHGLRAWQRQRRNRHRRIASRSVIAGLMLVSCGWVAPDPVNPFVITGLMETSEKLRLDRAQAIAEAVQSRQAQQQAAQRSAPPFLSTEVTPLPPAPFPAAEIKCLADAVYFDARGDNISGQIAVAQVFMNRLRESPGSTFCQLVQAALASGDLCRSSLWCPKLGVRNTSNRYWLQAHWIAEDVAAGRAYLRELWHAQRYHYYLYQPAWRLTQRPVRRLGQNIFYTAAPHSPDLTYASPTRPWDEPAHVEMLGESEVLSAGLLVPSSGPAPATPLTRKVPPPPPHATEKKPAFNPFANNNDQR
jgi:spore germination cell wall hydrolase CwlJ-like protein